ncbi:DUF2637 domain-containing protein [Actinomadura viridis]|uniref:DUF2637 domain-containing protein n=1 Tax=Actinomadura viridis TaxID=58110 RepID=A0A931GP27_9ACTN|nr:DUF2637 domain-containing protein [Actinomadura viridis]MBG6086989.1 hypothetical protein [Actinomadura viridis]
MTRRVLGAVADSGPVLVLAVIAAAGSFTHIRDTATEHGQTGWMAWAIAVCIDLTCVMAAGERQRDKRTGRRTGRLSWPTLVLVGGILLSLAANLAQADPTVWGWITAGTPAGAFLVAVSMLERRKTGGAPAGLSAAPSSDVPDVMTAPPSFGRPEAEPSPSSVPAVQNGPRSKLAAPVPAAPDENQDRDGDEDEGGQTTIPVPEQDDPSPTAPPSPASAPAVPLVAFARRVANEHQDRHGRPITRDALRARLGVSNQLASDLLRQIRTETTGHPNQEGQAA